MSRRHIPEICSLGVLLLGAAAARADVVVAAAGGFVVRSAVVVPASPAQAWKRFVAADMNADGHPFERRVHV